MRLAIVGAYGAGKTTLARALHRATGRPVAPVGPMADPERGRHLPLARCTLAQVFQLSLRRHDERARHESALGASLVSDGSLLHEWVYLQVLARWPDPPAPPPDDPAHAACVAHLADHAIAETTQVLGDRYDLVVHLAPERPLPPGAPISTAFQHALDGATRAALTRADVAVVHARGTLTARVRTVLDAVDGRLAA